jgi:hypothetical protein
VQHATYILNMDCTVCLLIGLVVVLLHKTLFTTQKRVQVVDINHGLNLGSKELIRQMEGTNRGGQLSVRLSSTVNDVHRAVESEIEKIIWN